MTMTMTMAVRIVLWISVLNLVFLLAKIAFNVFGVMISGGPQ